MNAWYNLYEDVISKERSTLDDAKKACRIVSKLDAITDRFNADVMDGRSVQRPVT